ncbi:MAG: putative glycoside hydrolase [Candidatus Cloacimonadales bacterium]|nr:putative glycoside hydrolase [Candidatus Cloacimonadales bacterium]
MRIKNIILLIIVVLVFSCKYERQTAKNLQTEIKQDSLKITNKEKSVKAEQSLFSESEEKEKNRLQNSDKIEQETIVDTIKVKSKANIIKEIKDSFKKKKDVEFIRGLYLTAYKIASSDFENILDMADSGRINTVVFDLKNMNGDIFFKTAQNQLLTPQNLKPIVNIASTVKTLHGRNMKAVSRMVMFHDLYNAKRDSDLRPLLPDGSVWTESKKRGPAWLDSSNPIVQNYLLGLIEEVAKSGVDEIQLDYIRFPTQGNAEKAIYYFQRADSLMLGQDSTYVRRTKAEIISGFLRRVKKICQKYDVTLSADVFAIVAWQRAVDVSSTGQDIKMMTKYLDYIHPMIYSSHFDDNFGYRENVANEPYFILYKGTKLAEQYSNVNCKVVPYIQANTWKVNYKKEYIVAQISAIEELKAGGYLLWNSSNNYKRTLIWLKEYYETN